MSKSTVLSVTRRSISLGMLISLAAGLLLTGGCYSKDVVQVNASNFDQEVLQSDVPVMVDFDKGGCPTCIPVIGIMNDLEKEYKGRVKIAHFMIMTPQWTFPSWETKQKYGIYYVPTVILFDRGQEVKRWNMGYVASSYRDALETQLANRPPATSQATRPTSSSKPATAAQPTATPSPSPTPKATPSPSPSPTPKAVPTAAPKATPTPKAGQPDLIP